VESHLGPEPETSGLAAFANFGGILYCWWAPQVITIDRQNVRLPDADQVDML
jgi:hypothetical protein